MWDLRLIQFEETFFKDFKFTNQVETWKGLVQMREPKTIILLVSFLIHFCFGCFKTQKKGNILMQNVLFNKKINSLPSLIGKNYLIKNNFYAMSTMCQRH